MKYMKMVGLVAVAAAALVAFVGAGSASAATLCKAEESTCAGANQYAAGTTIEASLQSGTKAVLDPSSGSNVECTGSSLALKTTAASGTPLPGQLTSLTFSGCTQGEQKCTVTATALGKGSVTAGKGGAGTINTNGETRVEVDCTNGFIQCTYSDANVSLDVTTAGATDKAVASNESLTKTGGFFCPSSATWSATYVVSKPTPLYLSEKP